MLRTLGYTRPFTFGLPLMVAVVCILSSLGWGVVNKSIRVVSFASSAFIRGSK